MCTKGRDLFAATSDESPLRGIPRSRGTVAAPGPDGDRVSTITRPSRKRREIALIPSMSRACSPGHLRASQTCYCSFSYGFEPPIPLRRRPRTHLLPTTRLTPGPDDPRTASRNGGSDGSGEAAARGNRGILRSIPRSPSRKWLAFFKRHLHRSGSAGFHLSRPRSA